MVLKNLFAAQQWRSRHREQICGHSRGRRGQDEWREQDGNIYMESYISICEIANGNLMYDSGNSNTCSVST